MTREEAIEVLSRPFHMKSTPQEILDAHKMAIKALELQDEIEERLMNDKVKGMSFAFDSKKREKGVIMKEKLIYEINNLYNHKKIDAYECAKLLDMIEELVKEND